MGIDAPEVAHPRKAAGTTPGQHYGEEARRALTDLLLKQSVEVEVYGRDRHGRILGVLRHGATNVNLWLVPSGFAWYHRGGQSEAPPLLRWELEAAELEAREAIRGLWRDPDPEPPWKFRRRIKFGCYTGS